MCARIPNRTEELARFAAGFPSAEIPQEVRDRALTLLIDLVGSIVRAVADSELSPSLVRAVDRVGLSGEARCTVFGMARRYGPAAAALLNGALGHSLDYDDTHARSSLHPSAPVVPAALAAAEVTGASGAALLDAVVIGYEVCCRLGNALDPAAHYARGFHPTATAGVFGACAAAGRLLALDEDRMVAAFGVAASQASGSLQFLENGAWNKPYQVGEAAMKGLLAATLAAEGFKGAIDAVDGRRGFLAAYSDETRPELATAGLGHTWETMRIGVKPYPSCRYTHAAVDGLLQLRARHNWQADDVERITVGLHRNGIALTGAPEPAKRRPRNVVGGQFSMPFAAGVAMLRGRFSWDDYELLGTPEMDALCDRVDVTHDPSLESAPHPFGATLSIQSGAGMHHLRIADPSGEPGTFPDDDALGAKFHGLAAPVLTTRVDALYGQLRALPQAESLHSYFSEEKPALIEAIQ